MNDSHAVLACTIAGTPTKTAEMSDTGEIEFDKTTVEAILKKTNQITDLGKVIEVTAEAAVAKYENFVSDLLRLTVRIESTEGKITNKSVILKQKRQEKTSIDFTEALRAFYTETKIYTEVLTTLDKILMEHQEEDNKMWADIITYAENKIFFEDLQELGYKLAKKGQGHDIEHATLVMKSLGKLHALSLVAVHNKSLDITMLGPSAFAQDIPFMNNFYEKGVNDLCKFIENNCDQKWPGIINKIRTDGEDVGKKLKTLYESTKGKYDVINHGDCWSNNIMFKYLPETNTPVSIRFVDFQLSHFNSLGWDLNYYLYNSIRSSMRLKYLPKLLETYTESLNSNAHKFGYTGKVPNLDDVHKAFDEVSFFGKMIALTQTPYMISMGQSDFEFHVDDILEENTDKVMFNCYHSTTVANEMKETIQELLEKKLM